MSEPEIEWYVHRIKVMLGEINSLILQSNATNSIKEIISHDTNEIEIKLHIIIRKLEEKKDLQKELLDLITLMPDFQTQEIVDYIKELREIRRMKK